MESSSRFRVRDAFPDDDDHAMLVSLLVATRHLNVLALANPPKGDPTAAREFLIHTFLASIATVSEIYELFDAADKRGLFAFIDEEGDLETQVALRRVRVRCGDPAVTRPITKVRNNAGAHWSPKVTRQVLREIGDKEYEVLQGATPVLSQEVAIRIARSMGYKEQTDDRTFWTTVILSDVQRVVFAAYLRAAYG